MLYQLSYASPNSLIDPTKTAPCKPRPQNAHQCPRRVRRSRNFSIARPQRQNAFILISTYEATRTANRSLAYWRSFFGQLRSMQGRSIST